MPTRSKATTSSRTRPAPTTPASPYAPIEERRSRIHGAGVVALAPIAKGARIVEYTGERITQAEADRRYEDRAYSDNHTFLFQISSRTVVDGGVGGNVSRFINHSCEPNCEVEIVRGRIFVEAKRAITAGEELGYDYSLVRTPEDPPDIDAVFACRCGAPTCRGSMMAAKPKRRVVKKAATQSAKRTPASRSAKKAPARKGATRSAKKAPAAKGAQKASSRKR